MNFIVGRILKVLEGSNEKYNRIAAFNVDQDEQDEEEAFWIFTMLIESLLPIDYYSNMVGVLIDQKILYDLFKQKIPLLCDHLRLIGFDQSLLGFQWLVCFLSYNINSDISIKIWDMFLINGIKVIMKFSLALFHMMKNDLMKTNDFAEIFEILDSYPRKLIDSKTLI